MSMPVAQKIAEGKRLSDEEIEYAVEHALNIPEEYLANYTHKGPSGVPLVQTGPAFAHPSGQEAAPRVVLLDTMTVKQLEEFAAANGIELESTKKKDMQRELADALQVEDEEDEELVEDEEDEELVEEDEEESE